MWFVEWWRFMLSGFWIWLGSFLLLSMLVHKGTGFISIVKKYTFTDKPEKENNE